MRPSNKEGIVAVLDTVPECKIVLSALDDSSFSNGPKVETFYDFANATGVRFRQQTTHEPRPPHASAYVEPVLINNPEFEVTVQDIDLITRAAKRITEEKRTTQKVFNSLTGRTKAAKGILSFFQKIDIE